MWSKHSTTTISQLGEKAIIEELLRPLFNPEQDKNLAGDDCAVIEIPSNALLLASTDRVPADLISFKAGIVSYEQLGRYLGVLNLSDIAACGGTPIALLFNCGLPPTMLVQDFAAISGGLNQLARAYGAKVAGGDVTSSSELSLSATVLGHVEASNILRRSGAKAGDSIFVSREIGLTPVALDYCLNRSDYRGLPPEKLLRLEKQFTAIEPEIRLGRKLAASGQCSSCMDNTDGVGQSLSELARESGCAFVIQAREIILDSIVASMATQRGLSALDFALGAGADFSLIGTLIGDWSNEKAKIAFGPDMQVIGKVTAGTGVHIERAEGIEPLTVRGWNYFQPIDAPLVREP